MRLLAKFYSKITVACLAGVWLCVGLLASANAGLVAYEGFGYNSGHPLHGQSGGTGWNGGWNAVSGSALATVNNGAAEVSFPDTGASRETHVKRSLSTIGTNFGEAGTFTWIRFDGSYSFSSTDSSFGGVSLRNGDSEKLLIGKSDGLGNWSISLGGSQAFTTVHVSGPLSDVWVRISHIAGTENDLVDLWVNPTDFSSEAGLNNSPVGSKANLTGLDVNFDSISLLADRGNTSGVTRTWTFDNIRVGTSFGAMTAVPEPSSMLLMGAFLAMMGVARRRTV